MDEVRLSFDNEASKRMSKPELTLKARTEKNVTLSTTSKGQGLMRKREIPSN
jgi:hypothetical protein